MTTSSNAPRRSGLVTSLAGAVLTASLLSALGMTSALAWPAQADVCANYVDFPGTKPQDDTDGDCLPTFAESIYKTNPNNPDTDGDKLSDLDEVVKYKTDPNRLDTDGDTENDFIELFLYKKDPLDPKSHSDAVGTSRPPAAPAPKPPSALQPRGDQDADGLFNEDETNEYGTDPRKADTDGDGADDGQEIFDGSDPLDPNDP